jgi:aarF domain-containing kinase
LHGIIRCSRVTVALIQSVYDYRMVMRHAKDDDYTERMSACHLRSAQRALFVFEKNGGIYIKLGQHLAALSYLIPLVCCA